MEYSDSQKYCAICEARRMHKKKIRGNWLAIHFDNQFHVKSVRACASLESARKCENHKNGNFTIGQNPNNACHYITPNTTAYTVLTTIGIIQNMTQGEKNHGITQTAL